MGPTVCELEGPIPILNNSKTLTAMFFFRACLCDDPNPVQGQYEDNSMGQLLLYYTEHCHLCDEAETLLQIAGLGDRYSKVEIENDPGLLELYEIHIPVLKRVDNNKELFWPFDQGELALFLGNGT